MNLELEESVLIKTKDGEFRGKVMQFETSKRVNSTVYRVMIHVYDSKNNQPLKAKMMDLTKAFPTPDAK